jgi:hypothetical protein
MRKVSIKIKDIKIIDEKLLILDENSEYYSPIVKGSVSCDVFTFDGKILPFSQGIIYNCYRSLCLRLDIFNKDKEENWKPIIWKTNNNNR